MKTKLCPYFPINSPILYPPVFLKGTVLPTSINLKAYFIFYLVITSCSISSSIAIHSFTPHQDPAAGQEVSKLLGI